MYSLLSKSVVVLTYSKVGTEEELVTDPLTKALLTIGNFWSDNIMKFHQTKTVNSSMPPHISCRDHSVEFWEAGKDLYK